MAKQLFTGEDGNNEVEVWEGGKGGGRRREWRVIGRNWQKRNYHMEKGQESRKNGITYICNVYGGGGEGGWGDGEGCMGNIWEGLELIRADETGGEGKGQGIE
jgi:hypothetical protein